MKNKFFNSIRLWIILNRVKSTIISIVIIGGTIYYGSNYFKEKKISEFARKCNKLTNAYVEKIKPIKYLSSPFETDILILKYQIEVSYTVKKQTFKRSRYINRKLGEKIFAGDSITIVYNQDKPRQFVLYEEKIYGLER